MKNKTTKLFLILTTLALALSACGGEETPMPPATTFLDIEAVVAEGHIIPNQDVMLAFSASGKVAEILVSEGQSVTKGQTLIRLADQEQAEAALRATELELTSAQQAYDDFVRTGGLSTADAWQSYLGAQIVRAEAEREWEDPNIDTIEDRIDDALAKVEDFQTDLEDAQDEFDKYKDLDKDNDSRKDAEDDLEKAQEDLNEAVRELEEERREMDSIRATLDAALSAENEAKRKYESRADDGLDPDQKALLDARLENASAQMAAATSALANYELKAPFNGVVTDINVKVGQLIGPSVWAAQMADFSDWFVETSNLTELEVVKIYEGQTVEIVPDALPELTLKGTIESISQSYKTQAGDVIYTVNIHLDESDPSLRWGMTVETTFIAE